MTPRTDLRLEPGPGLRTLPFPLLFARLSLLACPSADLEAALEEQGAKNPLLSVEPPRATGSREPAASGGAVAAPISGSSATPFGKTLR